MSLFGYNLRDPPAKKPANLGIKSDITKLFPLQIHRAFLVLFPVFL